MNRVRWVDGIRGIAILLMIVFHFCYDLRYFGWVDWNVPNGPNWWPIRYLILTLFIFTMGVSLSLAHGSGVRWRGYGIRLVQMSAAAAAITLMSIYMFPGAWIYFGILHFLVLASVATIFFVRAPMAALAVGLLILLLYWSGEVDSRWPFDLIAGLPSRTEDYVPLFPWLGVALVGLAFGGLAPIGKFGVLFFWIPGFVSRIGRHGLAIYILHQPIMFGVLYLVARYL